MLDLIETYLSELKANPEYSPRTHEQYRSKLRQFKRWVEADPGGRSFERSSIVTYLRERQREIEPKSLRIILTALRSFGTWMKERDLGEMPDLERISLPKGGKPRRRKPSDEEVQKLYQSADTLPQFNAALERRRYLSRAIVALLCECGLRTSELLALNVGDLVQPKGRDADGNPLPWRVRVLEGKGAEWAELPVSAEAQVWLQEWLDYRATWAAERRMQGEARDALFPVSKIRRMGYRALKVLWEELLEFAGLGDSELKRHSMRHWFGTTVAAREDLRTAQELLRHKSIRTTEQYLYTTDAKVRKAVSAVSELARSARSAERGPVLDSCLKPATPAEGRPVRGRARFQRRPAAAA